jgi:hypothetical protein
MSQALLGVQIGKGIAAPLWPAMNCVAVPQTGPFSVRP